MIARTVLAGFLAAAPLAAQDRENLADRILAGDTAALDELCEEPRPETVALLCRVIDGLDTPQLVTALGALGREPAIDGVVDTWLEHLDHADDDVWVAVRKGLVGARSVPLFTHILDQIASATGDLRRRIVVVDRMQERIARDLADDDGAWRHRDQLEAWERARDRAWEVLAPLLHHGDPAVRMATIDAVENYAQPGVLDALAALADDADSNVRSKAAAALTERGDLRMFEQRFQDAFGDGDYGIACVQVGWYYGGCLVPRVLEEYRRAAGDDARRQGLEDVLRGAVHVSRTQGTHATLTAALGSSDAAVRELAAKNLAGWRPRSREPDTTLRDTLYVLAILAFVLLGLSTYVGAFRLLQLRRVLRDLPVTPTGAVALGRVAVRGVARAVDRTVRHPVTGEACVWFDGFANGTENAVFRVVDDSGSVLVDPRDAALLSDDRAVTDGETVHVVGTARAAANGGIVIGRREQQVRPLFRRACDLVLGVAFGIRRRGTTARLLFEDARACFCVWDDARERPLTRVRETAMLFFGLAFAGAWILVALLTLAA